MKVNAIVFLTIIISTFTHGAAPPPKCEAKDVGTFKPNYDDNSWYYQCTDVDKYVSLSCYGGKWFSFAHQECVKKSEWLPPFISTTPATAAVTVPYATIEPNHPTPPTEIPQDAPTPAPTAADTPEPTLPINPPIGL